MDIFKLAQKCKRLGGTVQYFITYKHYIFINSGMILQHIPHQKIFIISFDLQIVNVFFFNHSENGINYC